MKISMVVTVDVDPNAWHEVYGCGIRRDDVRTDLVQYVTTVLQGVLGKQADRPEVRELSVRSNGKESR